MTADGRETHGSWLERSAWLMVGVRMLAVLLGDSAAVLEGGGVTLVGAG